MWGDLSDHCEEAVGVEVSTAYLWEEVRKGEGCGRGGGRMRWREEGRLVNGEGSMRGG